MISTFALHPAGSKHLIAQAVARLPQVQNALTNGKILIGHGTTNIAVMEELLKIKTPIPETHVAGIVTQNVACATEPALREGLWCIEKGQILNVNWLDFLPTLGPGDLFIKGANAIDPSGQVAILLGDDSGGSIGRSIGILKARGIEIISPVGLEKLIPSCRQAEKNLGMYKTDPRLGLRLGYMVLANTTVITELESIKTLFGLDSVQIGAGGVAGMEGAVILAAESEDENQLLALLDFVKQANRRPAMKIKKKACADCSDPCALLEKKQS